MACKPTRVSTRVPVVVQIVTRNPETRLHIGRALRSSRQLQVRILEQCPDVSFDMNFAPSILVLDSECVRINAAPTLCSEQFAKSRKLIVGNLEFSEACRLLSMGIHGFLRYQEITKYLEKALLLLLDGHLYIPRQLLERYVSYTQSYARRAFGLHKPLTSRQEQIRQLVRNGKTNKEIGLALNISENTVKFHLVKLFGKLGINDRRAVSDAAGIH
jgi:DNA-binding NarL/FixJ family response regulator